MPPGNSHYTLVGFSPELDWRPLNFVKPIPPYRLCSACGLVRKRVASLPCMHVLCEACYEQCAQEGLHVCPLDGFECHDEDDVDWKDFPADQLLRREVRCWNEERGCNSVMAASGVSRHFQLECGHHLVSCPKCSARVPCGDVCSHLRSGCDRNVTPFYSGAEVPPEAKDDSACFSTFRAAFEKHTTESRKLFERLALDTAMHGDRLNEMSHSINTLRETLKQDLAAETRRNQDIFTKSTRDITVSAKEVKVCFSTLSDAINNLPRSNDTLRKALRDDFVKETKGARDCLSQIATSINAEIQKNTQTTVEKIRQFIGHPNLQVAVSIFNVKGIKELREKVLKEGSAMYESGKVYLRGYCVIPGVYLKKEGESMKLCAKFVLCKGDIDDILQWPFKHKVSLSVVHPKDGSESEHVSEPDHSLRSFQRPTQPQNIPCYFQGSTLDLSDLIVYGFVNNDRLLVRWKLYPRDEHE